MTSRVAKALGLASTLAVLAMALPLGGCYGFGHGTTTWTNPATGEVRYCDTDACDRPYQDAGWIGVAQPI